MKKFIAGKNLSDIITAEYCSIDTETNQEDEIIEIAAVKISFGKEVGRISSLLKPPTQIEIGGRSFQKNHISNKMVENAPAIEQYLPIFLDFVGNSVILEQGGKNNLNDIPRICKAAEKIGQVFRPDYVNLCELSFKIFSRREIPNHKLETMSIYYGIRPKTVHRALPDAIDAYRIYESMVMQVRFLKQERNSIWSKILFDLYKK